MNIRQVFLYCILAIVGMFLWKAWVEDHPTPSHTTNGTTVTAEPEGNQTSSSYTPSSFHSTTEQRDASYRSNSSSIEKSSSFQESKHLIYAKTDLLDIGFSEKGGNIVSLKLLKYPTSLKEKNEALQLISSQQKNFYINQSGLTGVDDQAITFKSAQQNYQLADGKNELQIVLTGTTKKGLVINKIYRVERDKYLIQLNEQVKNTSSQIWKGSFYYQIQRKKPVNGKSGGVLKGRVYDGVSISSPEKRYKKVTYKDMDASNLSENIQNGWIAMQQRYFVNALIPPSTQTMHYYSREYQNDIYTIGMVSPEINLAPGKEASFKTKYYIGPKINTRLKAAAPGLDLTINYGWLWIISDGIFWVMSKINLLVGNWGWTIVLITILIKLLFYPLSAASFRSMGKMHKMQPRIKALKERFGDDKKALSQATMDLYRKEKINPLGGCLPMLIQIPVFIALYYVLIESVQLRQAPFIFWIHDLSAKDPYYILPILMGGSMFLTQKLSSVSIDPNQAKMMMALPVVFTVLFANFPSGLVLYWLINNCVQGLQQWYVMKKIGKKSTKPTKRRR
jgi:YidC/Oxa1 family membrane protein insertase